MIEQTLVNELQLAAS